MKTVNAINENPSHPLLPHLPPAPAAILVIGCESDFNTGDLPSLGYDVTVTDTGKFCGDGIDSNDPALSAKPYDGIVLAASSATDGFLNDVLKPIRSCLKPAGALIVHTEIPEQPLYQRKTGMSKAVLTALYENGFRIKSNDRMIKEGKETRFGLVVAKKDKVFLRVYRDGDELDILPMFQQVFQSDRTLAHWKWKYRDNPFGNHKIALAVTQDGALAAHFCGYAVPFYSSVEGPGEFLSLQGADTMTHPDFRRMGLGSTSVLTRVTTYFFNKFCVDNMPFMYGYNTGHIKKFGERFLGYQYMSPIPYHVLDFDRFGRPPLTLLGKFKKRLSFVTVERVTRMTAAFDLLFKRASRDYGLLLKKDATYLKWRYLDCPDHVHRLFAVKCFGKLVGWCVFSVRDRVLIWGDALFEKKYAWCVGAMFDRLLKKHFSDVGRIEGWFSRKPKWWTEALAKAGFEVTADPNQLAAGIIFFDAALSLPVVDRHFYYTMGDSDLF
ncbi:MAG: GNAT family N-acetyltransferase [Deltaproteobacteria bacterium]|nr:GNAT family N-acetyltransferase [Deltaproteobacteria bacterium]